YLGTGHVLVGLLAGAEDAAERALADLGVGLEAARAQLARTSWPADEAETSIGPTARLERALGLAAAEARRGGTRDVDTGHLLLGLLAEADGVVAGVLRGLGTDRETARAAIERG